MTLTLESLHLTTPFGVLPGDRVANFHAHPDDESVANTAALKALQESDAQIIGIIATDGEASDRGDEDDLRSGARRKEGRAAYKYLGVPAHSLHFLGLPDGQLHQPEELSRMTERFTSLIGQFGLTHLITPGEAGFGGHKDHLAVHDAVIAAQKRAADIFDQEPAQVWGLSEASTEMVFEVDTDAKLRALSHHTSQFTIQDKPDDGETDWERMGSFWLAPRSAQLLAEYTTLLTLREAYKQYA